MSILKCILVDKNFQTWLLIGQPIRSQFWKFLSTNMHFNVVVFFFFLSSPRCLLVVFFPLITWWSDLLCHSSPFWPACGTIAIAYYEDQSFCNQTLGWPTEAHNDPHMGPIATETGDDYRCRRVFQKHLWALKFSPWIKSASFIVWVGYFVLNFKGTLWNSTQNILPIHWKILILYNIFKRS